MRYDADTNTLALEELIKKRDAKSAKSQMERAVKRIHTPEATTKVNPLAFVGKKMSSTKKVLRKRKTPDVECASGSFC